MMAATTLVAMNLIYKTIDMKHFLFLLITLFIISCGKDDACTEINFGESIALTTETLVCINGTEYTFIAEDQRCCCGCVCVWEGEFVLMFEDSEGAVVYTFHESLETDNLEPPFAEGMEIISITNQEPDCGDNSKIDEVSFTIQVN